MATTTQNYDPNKLKECVQNSLEDDKAENIIAIDLDETAALADMMFIASGRSTRQVAAIANHLLSRLKDLGYKAIRVEGLNQADWVLIDAGDVVVHVFRPEVRDFYNLERIWAPDMMPSTTPSSAQI